MIGGSNGIPIWVVIQVAVSFLLIMRFGPAFFDGNRGAFAECRRTWQVTDLREAARYEHPREFGRR